MKTLGDISIPPGFDSWMENGRTVYCPTFASISGSCGKRCFGSPQEWLEILENGLNCTSDQYEFIVWIKATGSYPDNKSEITLPPRRVWVLGRINETQKWIPVQFLGRTGSLQDWWDGDNLRNDIVEWRNNEKD